MHPPVAIQCTTGKQQEATTLRHGLQPRRTTHLAAAQPAMATVLLEDSLTMAGGGWLARLFVYLHTPTLEIPQTPYLPSSAPRLFLPRRVLLRTPCTVRAAPWPAPVRCTCRPLHCPATKASSLGRVRQRACEQAPVDELADGSLAGQTRSGLVSRFALCGRIAGSLAVL